MNKKGFTLIELLAVIVILAIIALIATPIILSMINNARKSAAKSSAYGYFEAIDSHNGFVEAEVDGYTNKIEDGTHQVSDISVKMKGKAPESGTVTILNGKVKQASICISGFIIDYDITSSKEVSVGAKCGESVPTPKTYTVGEAINYNPVSNAKCNTPVSTTGQKDGCMKWYVIKNNENSVDALLDHNTTAKVAWNSSGSNSSIGEAATALSNDVSGWNTAVKNTARLIEASEVATITGHSSVVEFNFGTNSNASWLLDHVYNCTSYGCSAVDGGIDGYWTSTPVADSTFRSWTVTWGANLDDKDVFVSGTYGVRPVITISKSALQ